MITHVIFILFLFTGSPLVFAQMEQVRLGLSLGHSEKVNTALFSPVRNKVHTASRDATARIWDAQSDLLRTIRTDAYSGDPSPFTKEYTFTYEEQ